MQRLTPLVEPLSIDEAFLDLSGTATLHGAAPAQLLAALARRVEARLGITISIGLSYNKFLAKLASDLDKPRGFAVIGRHEAAGFLADKPVGWLWGVGGAMQRRLAADGIMRIGQLRALDAARTGAALRPARDAPGPAGARRGRPPHRPRGPGALDLGGDHLRPRRGGAEALARFLRPLCDRVSDRLKQSGLLPAASR